MLPFKFPSIWHSIFRGDEKVKGYGHQIGDWYHDTVYLFSNSVFISFTASITVAYKKQSGIIQNIKYTKIIIIKLQI